MTRWRAAFGRAVREVRTDLREDRYLRYVLLATLALAAFWFWHRVPMFATWDEHDRVLDVLVAYGSVVADPSVEALRDGVSWGRAPFGATFYVYAVAVFPVVLLAALTGNLDVIAAIRDPAATYAHYPVWAETPAWVWTASLVLVRLTNVVFAVVTVYLVYRLGADLRDRWTGRLAAAALALTFGFLKLAKEGGEDVPATMCVVAALLLLVRYVRTGDRWRFYAASAVGGAGLAFKLTLAPLVPVFGVAFLLEARTDEGSWRAVLWRPRVLLTGAAVGAVAIVLGFPTALVGDLDAVWARLFGRTGRGGLAVGPTAPVWWWFLRSYASAFGWPLLVGVVGGVAASLGTLWRLAPARSDLRERAPDFDAYLLVVAALAGFLLFFGTWHDFRVHHLLPTLPLAAVLAADAGRRLCARRETVGRVAVAVVLVGAAAYAGVGVGMYASMPREDATDWLETHADDDATMETYFHGFMENAIPHDMRVNPIWLGMNDPRVERCPEYIQLGYKELLYLQDIPKSQLSYDVDTNVDARERYVRALLAGEYNYDIVAEFGPRPPNFVPERPTPGSLVDLAVLGINPHSDQYGDEQELTMNQYVAILRHDGPCVETRVPPW